MRGFVWPIEEDAKLIWSKGRGSEKLALCEYHCYVYVHRTVYWLVCVFHSYSEVIWQIEVTAHASAEQAIERAEACLGPQTAQRQGYRN